MFEYLRHLLSEFWGTVGEMSPYLLFGFLVASLLSMFVSQRLVERHLSRRGIGPLIKASLLGIPLPLCSCGVIPVSMSLYKHGASRGATVAFLLSTPQTGVDSIFVTYSLLGPVITIFRPVAALLTGLLGGSIVDLTSGSNSRSAEHDQCTDGCCSRTGIQNRLKGGLKYGFVTLPRDIGRAMLVGLAIAAAISAFVPDGYLAERMGGGFGAMLVMMVIGIPVYVCATASVPVAAALIMKGISPGAALVFLMTGPATNAASFTTIWKVLGRRTAVTYILVVAGCSLVCGLALDVLVGAIDIDVTAGGVGMLPPVVKNACAVVLIVLLAGARLTKGKHSEGSSDGHEEAGQGGGLTCE